MTAKINTRFSEQNLLSARDLFEQARELPSHSKPTSSGNPDGDSAPAQRVGRSKPWTAETFLRSK